ncbi:sulfatase [Haloterrigena salifodinae]|uniref:Sulfatase n=1 Tax=Haloterrigena salifodinae TaxID=2675099 RepID=A0A8T8E2R2_9EURY|nr:sulfatase [Haloterrigena salifodinae]QRV15796.1 sulfatase [Haloterrigena salifodinae]
MIKEFARSGLDRFRRLKNRIAYASRTSNVPAPTLDEKQNVLVITVDCLRNDRVSQTGYQRDTTPFIDSLASFTPAVAAAPWTFSSVPSILTGLHPHNHGAAYADDSSRNQDLTNPPNGIREDVDTLAELLASSGYKTKFITAIGTAAVPIEGRFKSVERCHDANAETVLSKIKDWWNGRSDPKFGYAQLGDLHEPLHEPETTPFGRIPDIDGIDRWRFTSGDIQSQEFEQYRSARGLLYDTLVRYIDEQIESVFDELKELDDTLVIITSDHGEEFWEYKEFEEENFEDSRGLSGVGHGHALVPPVVEVPIATNIDGLPSTESRRSTTDIVPTILHELGADPPITFDGNPLQDASHEDKPVLSQEIAYGPNQISVTDGDDHLIYVPVDDRSMLLDFETGDSIVDPDLEARLLEHVPQERVTGSDVNLSEDVQARLSDLGYAE